MWIAQLTGIRMIEAQWLAIDSVFMLKNKKIVASECAPGRVVLCLVVELYNNDGRTRPSEVAPRQRRHGVAGNIYNIYT